MKSGTIGTASRRGGEQYLEHHVRAVQEIQLDGGQVELPHAAEPLVGECQGFVAASGEADTPVPDGVMVMQPQHLHVGHPKSGALGGGENLGQ